MKVKIKRTSRLIVTFLTVCVILYATSLIYIQSGYTVNLNYIYSKLTEGPKPEKVLEAEEILSSYVEELNNKYGNFLYEFDAKIIDFNVNNKRICGIYTYNNPGQIKDLSVHKSMLVEKVQQSNELAVDIKNRTDWDAWIITHFGQFDTTKDRCSRFVKEKTSNI